MTRRKCRTWQPNEITSIIRSSQESSGRESSPGSPDLGSSEAQPSQTSEPAHDPIAKNEEQLESNSINTSKEIGAHALVSSKDASVTDTTFEPGDKHHEGTAGSLQQERSNMAQETSDALLYGPVSKGEEGQQDSLDKKLSTGGNNTKDPNMKEGHLQQKPEVESPRKRIKRASSIRLSMSSDGKAQVVTGGNTPSPPSKLQTLSNSSRRSSGLQRSQSSVLPGEKQVPGVASTQSPWPPIRTHGRSRDARTWEFYCDSDARDALTKTAEDEQNGSALGAIRLIRSGSAGRGPLAPSIKRQNSQLQRQDSGKRKTSGKSGYKKPKLARTTSSYARLQGAEEKLEVGSKDSALKSGSQPAIWREPSGDSDKENWEPGTCSSQHRSRPTPSKELGTGRREILQENTRVPSHSSSLGAMMAKENLKPRRRLKQKAAAADEGKENVCVDEEVSAFMGESGIARKEDEMDAVQNLLSLSQGAWH